MTSTQTEVFLKRIKSYFHSYGGWNAIFCSPLLHLSFFLTVINYSTWISGTSHNLVITVIPSLLGFSLGTYAILFSLMTNTLKRALKERKNEKGVSYLQEINATFFHFIFIQILTLIFSLAIKSTLIGDVNKHLLESNIFVKDISSYTLIFVSIFEYLLLVYSCVLTLASALVIYRIAGIVDPND